MTNQDNKKAQIFTAPDKVIQAAELFAPDESQANEPIPMAGSAPEEAPAPAPAPEEGGFAASAPAEAPPPPAMSKAPKNPLASAADFGDFGGGGDFGFEAAEPEPEPGPPPSPTPEPSPEPTPEPVPEPEPTPPEPDVLGAVRETVEASPIVLGAQRVLGATRTGDEQHNEIMVYTIAAFIAAAGLLIILLHMVIRSMLRKR